MHEIQNMCVLIFFDNIYCCHNGRWWLNGNGLGLWEEVRVQKSIWTIMIMINMTGKRCDNVAKVNNIDNYLYKCHKFQQYVNSQPKRKTFFGVLESWIQGDDLDSSIKFLLLWN